MLTDYLMAYVDNSGEVVESLDAGKENLRLYKPILTLDTGKIYFTAPTFIVWLKHQRGFWMEEPELKTQLQHLGATQMQINFNRAGKIQRARFWCLQLQGETV
jgi:hypothetical protein